MSSRIHMSLVFSTVMGIINANKAECSQRLKLKYRGGTGVMVFTRKQPLSGDFQAHAGPFSRDGSVHRMLTYCARMRT